MNNLWGGRFGEGPSELLRAFNDSFAFDAELFAQDIEGSIAWAGALEKAADNFDLLSADIGLRIGDHVWTDSEHDFEQRAVLRLMQETAIGSAESARAALEGEAKR